MKRRCRGGDGVLLGRGIVHFWLTGTGIFLFLVAGIGNWENDYLAFTVIGNWEELNLAFTVIVKWEKTFDALAPCLLVDLYF